MKTKTRNEIFFELAKSRIKSLDSDEFDRVTEEYDCATGSDIDRLTCVLSQQYSGVTNGFLSEIYELLHGDFFEVIGEVSDLFECPCCGYKTLDERCNVEAGTGYDICVICRWEDDGTTDVNCRSGVNRGSISEYRENMESRKNYYYREKFRK